MHLLHTSDWQIGKAFGFAGDVTRVILRNERLDAIDQLRQRRKAKHDSSYSARGIGANTGFAGAAHRHSLTGMAGSFDRAA